MAVELLIRPIHSDGNDMALIREWNALPEIMRISNAAALTDDESLLDASETDSVYVIEFENDVIGCINITLNHRNALAEIGIMIGEREFRGQGIGTQALTKTLEQLKTNVAVNYAIAYIHETNTAARRLFESAGFQAGNTVWFKDFKATLYKFALR